MNSEICLSLNSVKNGVISLALKRKVKMFLQPSVVVVF